MGGESEEIGNGDKAAVIAGTEDNKEVDEMPPTYDEAKSLTTGETAVKITSNETKIDIGKEKEADQGFQGLTKDELMKYANDPFWVKLRWFLFILFWIVWVAMLAASIVIIIYAPKCPSPEPKRWWQKSPLYKVDIDTFQDSDGDGVGDLAGIQDKLDYLMETGVGTVYISSFFQSPKAATKGVDVQDYTAVDSTYGSMEDWKALVTALKERNQKVVIDFIPNHTSDQHLWFESSVANEEAYRDYYTWHEGGGAGTPPNDWTAADGGPAWTWSDERGAWYLHQFGASQPDLNLDNPLVVAELEKVLQHWISTGVNGFVIQDVPYMVDGPVSGPNDNSVIRQTEVLKKFRAVVDAETEDSGVPCVLYADVADLPADEVSALYGDDISGSNVGSLVHLPLANTLQDLSPGESLGITAQSLKTSFDNYILGLPVNAWPSFSLSSTQFEPELVDSLTMFKMLLPGTSLSFAGEELGLQNMNWDAVAAQKDGTLSHLKLYTELANKLRHQEAILFGMVDLNSTFVMDETVFGLTRLKKGNPGYLLAINFGDEEKTVDASGVKTVPASIRAMSRSIVAGDVAGVEMVDASVVETKRFDSNSIPLKAKEGKIFTFVPNFDG